MKISFDLDDTLLVRSDAPDIEVGSVPLVRGYIEEYFRAGCRELFSWLKQQHCEVGVYTNSYRGKSDLEQWFMANNMRIDFVINQQLHDGRVDSEPKRYSLPAKCPHLFGIDIHIDDLPEIKEGAELYGPKVILVEPLNVEWVQKLIVELKREITTS